MSRSDEDYHPDPDEQRASLESPRRMHAWYVTKLVDHARRLLSFVLSASLVLVTPGSTGFVLAQSQPESFDEALARVERFMDHVQELRSLIDRTQFDVEALAFELAFEDADTIVTWVREHIAFEPYVGLLRGAGGTLMSRAGNALDQALLLATLLKDAGYDARIVEGSLDADGVDALLAEVSVPVADPVWADPERVATTLREIGSLGIGDREALERLLSEVVSPPDPAEFGETSVRFDAFVEDLDFVYGALADANVEFTSDAADAAVRDDAAAYFWVQYRLASDGAWSDAHPSFASGKVPTGVVPSGAVFESEIPERLQHRVRFQVLSEQRLGSELIVRPVTAAWERPSANLHGTLQTFGNAPTNVSGLNDLTALREVLGSVQMLVPTFQGGIAEGGQFFDLSGNLVPRDAAAAPAAGVFSNIGNAFGGAAGALDGGSDPDSFVALSAQWIEYTLIAPGGAERGVRRVIFDRVGAENRAAGEIEFGDPMTDPEVVAALMGSHTFMVNVGSLPGGFVLDRMLEAAEAAGPSVAAVLQRAASPDAFAGPFAEDVAVPGSPVQLLRLYTTFDAVSFGDQIRSYRSAPSLVVVEQAAIVDADDILVRFAVDIVANEKRHLRVAEGHLPSFEPAAAVAAGVWETHAERMLFDIEEPDLVSIRHVHDSFAEARVRGTGFSVVSFAEGMDLQQYALGAEAAANLMRDLADGYVAIVALGSEDAVDTAGWWRVDPVTGETLGITGDGRGGVLIEYLKVFAYGFAAGFAACAIANIAITMIVRGATGEVWHEGAPISPQELVQCVVMGVAVGALSAAVLIPNVTMIGAGGKVATGGVPFQVMVAGGYTMVQFKSAVSALSIGFGFVLVQMNQYLVPDDWAFLGGD